MNLVKLLSLGPVAALTVFLWVGYSTGFPLAAMRVLSLALAAGLAPLAWYLGKRGSFSPIDQTVLAYFVFSAAILWLHPEGLGFWVLEHPLPLLYLAFFLRAVVPPLMGRPGFTEYFARKRTPPEVRGSDIYKRINAHMTWGWAAIFGTCLASTLSATLLFAEAEFWVQAVFLKILPLVLLLGIGLPFTKAYPDYYQRRLGLEPVRAGDPSFDRLSGRKRESENSKESKMEKKPKILAVNGSPHVGMGNTDIMLDMLRPVLEGQGMELEVIHLHESNIDYCVGCALCLAKGKCWQNDDHRGIVEKLLGADGVILASPVYFRHITAQMKTFLDRCLPYGHKPRGIWKPGLALSVSAGWGETSVGDYLAGVLRVFGCFSVGVFTAMATSPGAFTGEQAVRQRAADLAGDLARAIREKRRYPPNDQDLDFWNFMGWLVKDNREFMVDDHEHWERLGLFESFENYVGLPTTHPPRNQELYENWLKGMIAEKKAKRPGAGKGQVSDGEAGRAGGAASAQNCLELLRMMPLGFNPEEAGDLGAVLQFEVSGDEVFTAHLVIADGACVFNDGPAAKADLVVKTPADIWLGIAQGRINGQTAFMSGQYKAEGNLSLLLKMSQLFSKGR